MTDVPRVILAVVTRPHGLLGEVRAKVFNTDTSVLVSGARVQLAHDGKTRTVRIESARSAPDTWVVRIAGIETREAAEAIRGAELTVSRDELPEIEEGEFYHVDLVGCIALDTRGETLGTVREVIAYPSVDAIVVAREGAGDLEVPLVEDLVAIELAARRIIVDTDALAAT